MTLLRHDGSVLPATLASVKLLESCSRYRWHSESRWWRWSRPTTCRSPATTRPTARRRGRRASTPTASTAPPRGGCCAQVDLGPRPAGSAESRRLARLLHRIVPHGRYQDVPGRPAQRGGHRARPRAGLRGGRGALRHKDMPGFVGANDGASGTAVAAQLARTIRRPRHTVKFVFFDGEETPARDAGRPVRGEGPAGQQGGRRRFRGCPRDGAARLRGRPAARHPARGELVPALWRKLRAAARRVGALDVFPSGRPAARCSDDHLPFLGEGVPSIDLIDFDFPCWHRRCDDMSAVSERSLNAVGETMVRFLC